MNGPQIQHLMNSSTADGGGELLWVYKTADIRDIAKWQKYILILILAAIVISLVKVSGRFILVPDGAKDLPVWFTVVIYSIGIPLSIVTAVCTFGLATHVASGTAWLYAILSFIPLLGLIALLVLNQKATTVLRAKGLRAGLMRASDEELHRLSQEPTHKSPTDF